MKQHYEIPANSRSLPSRKLLKLTCLLQNAKISERKILLPDSEKLKNLSISTFYSTFVEKPINLLFSVDQFLFEFSKKTYQQKKTGEFFQQLKERKKLSLFYGHLTKKQLTNIFTLVTKNKGYFSKNVFSLLERRLDVVIYRSGFTKTILQARQLIKHHKIFVNDHLVNVPSYLLDPGDIISITPDLLRSLSNQLGEDLKTGPVKSHPQIFGDFYSKLKKTLGNRDEKIQTRANFQSQVLCNLMIQLICTKMKLRSFYYLKTNKQADSNQLKFVGIHNFTSSGKPFKLDTSNKLHSVKLEKLERFEKRVDKNHQETKIFILFKLKKGSLNRVKKTVSVKRNSKMRHKFTHVSKITQQYPVPGSARFLEKSPLFWNRSFINFNQRKSLSVKSQKFQKDSKKIKLLSQKKKNLVVFRTNFLVFLNCLENYHKFTSLLSLNMQKYLFKRSFLKRKSLFSKFLHFKLIKPLHLEISYSLLKIIYLYSPQRLNFPFYIDLDLIKRSLR